MCLKGLGDRSFMVAAESVRRNSLRCRVLNTRLRRGVSKSPGRWTALDASRLSRTSIGSARDGFHATKAMHESETGSAEQPPRWAGTRATVSDPSSSAYATHEGCNL